MPNSPTASTPATDFTPGGHTSNEQYQARMMALGIAMACSLPVILWGTVGIGKTKLIQSIARLFGFHFETVLVNASDPTDFGGMPTVIGNDLVYAPTPWVRRVLNAATKGMTSLVFWDEYSTGSPSVQGASLYPLLENKVGDTDLPMDTRHVAAANPVDLAAGGFDLTPPAANRFVHLDWTMPAEVWTQGILFGFPNVTLPTPDPQRVTAEVENAKVLVTSFIDRRPDLLNMQPETVTQDNVAFPSPRTWEYVIRLYGMAQAVGASDLTINMLLRGAVGDAAAGEFMTWVENLDLPDPEALLADPDKMPEMVDMQRSDKVFATCASVLNALSRENSKERWIAAGLVFAIVAEHGKADVAVVYASRWNNDFRPKGAPLDNPRIAQALAPVLSALGAFNK